MNEYPSQEHNSQDIKLAKELEALNDLTRYLNELEDSSEHIDLNEPSRTVTMQMGDNAVTKVILPIDKLREKKAALEEYLSNPDKSVANLKEQAQKQLWKADLYLIAHDKEEERIKKSSVIIDSGKPLTDPALLEKLKEADIKELAPEEVLGIIDEHMHA